MIVSVDLSYSSWTLVIVWELQFFVSWQGGQRKYLCRGIVVAVSSLRAGELAVALFVDLDLLVVVTRADSNGLRPR